MPCIRTCRFNGAADFLPEPLVPVGCATLSSRFLDEREQTRRLMFIFLCTTTVFVTGTYLLHLRILIFGFCIQQLLIACFVWAAVYTNFDQGRQYTLHCVHAIAHVDNRHQLTAPPTRPPQPLPPHVTQSAPQQMLPFWVPRMPLLHMPSMQRGVH